MAGKRRLIKCDDVKYINVPYFSGLSVDEIIEWAKGYSQGIAMESLPLIPKEVLHMPREFLCNCIYTIAGDDFQEWVSERIEERNAKVTSDKDLSIILDP